MNYRIAGPNSFTLHIEAISFVDAFYRGVIHTGMCGADLSRSIYDKSGSIYGFMRFITYRGAFKQQWIIVSEDVNLDTMNNHLTDFQKYESLYPLIERIQYKERSLPGVDTSLGFHDLLEVL